MFASFRERGQWLLIAMTALILLCCLLFGAAAAARPLSPSAYPALTEQLAPSAPYTMCGTLSFASPVTYTANTRPRSSTNGYLNADTNLDLIVTDYSANSVSVFLGNANGTFQPATNYGVGVHPVSVAVGDFNEDTKADLVVSNYDSANVSILLGNGDGTFQGAMNFSSNIGPYGVTVGDFNEDTHLDAATSNVNFGTINVMLGNGNGTLQSPVSYAAGLRPQVIAAGLFNADSHLDLVVPNYTASSVSIFLGNGNGTFQAAMTSTVTAYPDYLTLADLNLDGKDDLLLSHYVTTNTIGVALGNGNGTFQPEVTYPTDGLNPTFASAGDFNGDGILDLASPGYSSDNLSILLGNGNGTFQPAVVFLTPAGSSPVSVLPGDFNHDGRLDMFTANENTNDISVYISSCGPQTATPTVGPSDTATPTSTPTNPPTAVPSSTALTCTPWQLVPSDNVGTLDNYLYGVSAASANDVWAVGNYFNENFYSQTLIEHWDGTAWSVVPSPNPGSANNLLFAVTALSSGNAWAVGWYNNTNIQQPLVLHWDGTSWTDFPILVSRPRVVLQGISAVSQNDIWAVGVSCETALCSRHVTATLHYDGTAWSVVDTPNPTGYDNSFSAVSAAATNDVWAVGQACTDPGCSTSQSLIEHWNGTAWAVISSPSPGTAGTLLWGVDARPGYAWAVGEACSDGGCTSAQSVTLQWDGTTWSTVPSPNPGSVDTHLNAVAISAGDDVWAVGSQTSDGSTFSDVVMHWNSYDWSVVSVANPGSADNDLRGLARVASNNVWAVGDFDSGAGERTQVQHYAGSCVSATATTIPTATEANSATATITPLPSNTPTLSATSAPNLDLLGDIGIEGHCEFIFHLTVFTEPPGSYVPVTTTMHFSNVFGHEADYIVPPFTGSYTIDCSSEPCWPGHVYYDLTVDYNNNVQETNETNNTYELTHFFGPPCTTTPVLSPTPTTCPLTFSDVPQGSTFYSYIRCLACRLIVSGYSDGTFRPNNNVTRGQLSKIVSNSAGFNDPQTVQMFEDVSVGSTFFAYIGRLASRAYINGYPCGGTGEPCNPPGNLPYFRPNNNATRGQIAKIDSNAAGFVDPVAGQSFEDVPPGSTFYTYTQRLASRSVMSGYPCGGTAEPCIPPGNLPYFRPYNNATRGQTSKIVANTFFPDCQTPIRR